MPQWTSVAPLPVARTRHAAAAGGGKLYVAGGRTTSTALATASVYDPDLDAWSALPNLPNAADGARGACDSSGRFYVIGGGSSAGAVSTRLQRYDPATGAWTALAGFPASRRDHAAGIDNLGRVYVLGGADVNGNVVTTAARYDPNTDTWTTLPTPPNAGTGRSECVILPDPQGNMWVLGGYVSSTNNPCQDALIYYPDSNSWATTTNIPPSAQTLPAAFTDEQGRFVMAGGCISPNNNAGQTVVDRLSFTTGTWETLDPLATAVANPAGGRIGRRWYVTGGSPTRTGNGITTAQRYVGNNPPNAASKPTPDGQSLDRTADQAFSYSFSDPDAGDQSSATSWRWRTSPSSGTPGSWNTSTVTGTSTSITYPANTFPAGRIEVQALPTDSQGSQAAAWSESAFNTMVSPPGPPTFSAPAAGSSIATPNVTATIVASTLDAHQWRVMGDTGGTPNATVVKAGATIEDSTSRTFTVTGLANSQTVHLQDRIRVNGLWSTWADNGAQQVSYTPPATPTATYTPINDAGRLDVTYSNPTPSAGQPTVTSVEIWVNDGLGDGMTRRVADLPPSGSWAYRLARARWDYAAQIRVVAIAANGTTSQTLAT